MLTLELGNGVVMELAFITMAFAQGLPNPGQRIIAERDALQQARELFFQHLLACVPAPGTPP